MDSAFVTAFNYLMIREGGIANNPHDMGGLTKYGISLRFLRSLSPEKLKEYGVFVQEAAGEDDIQHLTIEQAQAIYLGEFWSAAPFDRVNVDMVRNYLFDMSVNMGVAPMTKCAQRAVWSIEGTRSVLLDDGIMGDETLYYINKSGTLLLNSLRSECAGYYRLIVEKSASQAGFLEGWLNRAYGA